MTPPGSVEAHGGPNLYYGKYRGRVVDNEDPLFQGRIRARVPAVGDESLNWALPCTPFAGPNVGFYAIPPIDSNVWIEFEGGDPGYPIWTGCFWGPNDVLPLAEPPLPEVKVFKTGSVTMVLDDRPEIGGLSLTMAQASVTMGPKGIKVAVAGSVIEISAQGVIVNRAPAEDMPPSD
jgi:hypothetical protein